MTAPSPWPSRVPKLFRKTIQFDGEAGNGATGTVAVATVSGAVAVTVGGVRCTEDLAGATATVEMGVAGNTAALIAQTTATDIDDGDFWQDATPEAGVSPAIVNQLVTGDIILTVATAAVTGGTLEVTFFYLPLSHDGELA